MKRIIFIITLLIIAFTLIGCDETIKQDNCTLNVYLSNNILADSKAECTVSGDGNVLTAKAMEDNSKHTLNFSGDFYILESDNNVIRMDGDVGKSRTTWVFYHLGQKLLDIVLY